MSDESRDLQELTEEVQVLRELNHNLAQRLELKENEIREMGEFIGELTSQSNEKSDAIARATKVIESLRDELQKARNDIENLELEKYKLSQEKRIQDKEMLEVHKENLNLENIKKAETRAKTKTLKLQDEISKLNQEWSLREQDLLAHIKELEADNAKMEMRMDENDTEVFQIKEQYKLKDKEYLNAMESISQLETENQELIHRIEDLVQEKENLENYYSRELRMVKKEAENNIKYYKNLTKGFTLGAEYKGKENEFDLPESQIYYQEQSNLINSNDASMISDNKILSRIPSQFLEHQRDDSAISQRPSVSRSAGKPSTGIRRKMESAKKKKEATTKKGLGRGIDDLQHQDAFETTAPQGRAGLKTSEQFLKAALAESIERENTLVDYIDKTLNKEAEAVNKLSEVVLNKEVMLRPEIERWMMRNEELEQRLFEYAQRMRVLEIMLKDCAKAAEISHGQRNTERRTNEQLVKELESMINFLHIEVQEKNKIILSLLPESEGYLTENVTVSQGKLGAVYNDYLQTDKDLSRVRDAKDELSYHFDDLKKKHSELLDYCYQLRNNIIDLAHILGLNMEGEEERLSQTEDVYDLPPMNYEAIVDKIGQLLDTEKEYGVFRLDTAEEKDKLRNEIRNLEREVRDLVDERSLAQQEKFDLQDEIAKLDSVLKDLDSKFEDAKRRIVNNERENEDLNGKLNECNNKIDDLKGDLFEKETLNREITDQLLLVKADLEQKTKNVENLMTQIDEAMEEKHLLLEKLTNANADYQQTFELLEKTLKDFEVTQDSLDENIQRLKERDEEIEELTHQASDLEIRLEETEFALKERERQLNEARIALDYKDSTVSMLENECRETKRREEELREDLTKLKMEVFEKPNATEILQRHAQTSRERPLTFASTERDFNNRSPLRYSHQGIQAFEEKRGSDSYFLQKRLEEYEVFLDYIQTNLKEIYEDRFRTQQSNTSFEERLQDAVSKNTVLADSYISIKHSLTTISSKFQDIIDSEAKFLTNITQALLDRLTLSSPERKFLEDECTVILNSSMRDRRPSYEMLFDLKESLLNILNRESTWEKKAPVARSPSPLKRKTAPATARTYQPDLTTKILAENILALSTNLVDQASLAKPIIDKLDKFKDILGRAGTQESAGLRGFMETILHTIEELIERSQTVLHTEAKILLEISLNLREGIQTKASDEPNLEIRIMDHSSETKELLNRCYERLIKADQEYREYSRNYNNNISQEHDKSFNNVTNKTMNDSKKELKNQSFQLLREFYDEIGDVINIFSKYCSKIESKTKSRHNRLSSLTEEPSSILKALEENLNKNNTDYIEAFKKEFYEYMTGEEETSRENQEFLQKLFTFRMKLFNVDKLQEETNNFKNVFRLLDISHLLKETANQDESQYLLNYEQIRTRSHEVNKTIEKVIEILPTVMLKTWNLIEFDKQSLNSIDDPQALYDKLRKAYSDPYTPIDKVTGHRMHVRYEIAQLLKENGGCRIAMNYLLYIFYKFKIIINDLSKEEA